MKKLYYSYVYAFHCKQDGGYYKVGYTSNLKSRMSQLQTSSPFPIELVCAIRTYYPQTLEKTLHGHLDDYRVAGEWFQTTEDVIRAAFARYAQNVTLDRWLKFFDLLETKYSYTPVLDGCVRLDKEGVFFCTLDYIPDKKGALRYADFAADTSAAVVLATSLPHLSVGDLNGVSSRVFLTVFGGAFCDIFDCSVCDIFGYTHPVYGRYREIQYAGIDKQDGRLVILGKDSDTPIWIAQLANEAVNCELPQNFIPNA
jgi:hypothetical protein